MINKTMIGDGRGRADSVRKYILLGRDKYRIQYYTIYSEYRIQYLLIVDCSMFWVCPPMYSGAYNLPRDKRRIYCLNAEDVADI